jgi:hypothetical protein
LARTYLDTPKESKPLSLCCELPFDARARGIALPSTCLDFSVKHLSLTDPAVSALQWLTH